MLRAPAALLERAVRALGQPARGGCALGDNNPLLLPAQVVGRAGPSSNPTGDHAKGEGVWDSTIRPCPGALRH